MKHYIWLLISLLLTFNFAFCQVEASFIYDGKGRRDPFLALVDERGRYHLDTELPYSSDELKLSGILWDPQGKSSVLINDQVVKTGESIYGFIIKKITKDSVTVSKDAKEYILKLSEKGKER